MHRAQEPESLRRRLSRRGYEIFRTRGNYTGEEAVHHHDFYEVDMVWSGTMYYRVEGRSYHLTPGDILLIAPDELHQPDPEAERGPCERIVLWVDRAFLQQFQFYGFDPTECFDTAKPDHSSCLRFRDGDTQRIGELLDRCLREDGSEEFGSGMMADTNMLQAMILINRLYRRDIQSERRGHSDTLVNRVLEYINSHYSEELNLDDLANRFFISKYHLSREFGRIVGMPVHRYIIQKRLAVAKQMLREGRPSSMVYQHCGFGDYSNFYRAFRNEYGVSPKAYAATLREEAAAQSTPAWMHRDVE